MATRRHDVDALRAIAFALLILYHASGIWQRGSDFHMVSHHQYDWIEWLRIVVNRWRMPLIFMLSGIALALSGAMASPGKSIRMRSWRLLLPLIFGMWCVVSVQVYCEAVTKGEISPGFMRFWLIYAQAGSTAAPKGDGSAYGITWNHLWYLAYLWCYTMVLLVIGLLPKPGWFRMLRRIPPGVWFSLGVMWTSVCLIVLQPRFPETHALVGDWYAHLNYLAFFVFGFLSAGSSGFRTWIDQSRWWLLVLALIGITIELGLRAIGRGIIPLGDIPSGLLVLPWAELERCARALYSWSAVLAILAWGQRWLDRPFRWLPWANDSVYPWYVLHQTWLVLIAYWIIPLRLGAGLEVLLVVGGTVLGCWVLSDGCIRRSNRIRPLFGLKPLAAATRSTARHRRLANHRA
ncbi:MAG: acyltransferase [Xanthomonadaceae bacterium]|nr:acyltransferase [Xanthomonadaceae bacterium]